MRIGRIDELREADGAEGRLALADFGMGRDVVAQLRLALFEQAVGQPSDAGIVLGVHHDHDSLAPRELEYRQDLVVVELETLVGEVELDRCAALLDQFAATPGSAPRASHRRRSDGIRSRHAPWSGAMVVVIDDGAQGLAAHLHGKRHHGGVAAAERRQGAAAKIVGRAASLPRAADPCGNGCPRRPAAPAARRHRWSCAPAGPAARCERSAHRARRYSSAAGPSGSTTVPPADGEVVDVRSLGGHGCDGSQLNSACSIESRQSLPALVAAAAEGMIDLWLSPGRECLYL